MQAPVHERESERLAAINKLGLLDTEPDDRFDALTREAIAKIRVPISTVTIVDEKREWYKSCQGLENREGPRAMAFCSWALLARDVFIVEDTLKDPRFQGNPYVTGPPHIRFYAGFALYDLASRLPVGAFCVKDTQPRKLTTDELSILFDISKRAEALINDAHGGVQ